MTRGISHPLEVLFGSGVGLSCDERGEVHAEELHGLFAGDTRVLSSYRFVVAGHSPRLLSRSRRSQSSAQWDFQNPTLRTPSGVLTEGTLHIRLRRRVDGALCDDWQVCAYVDEPLAICLALQLDADFADLFEVKARSTPPRLGVQRLLGDRSLSLVFERDDFRRALHVTFEPSAGDLQLVGSQIVFDVVLEPRQEWRLRVNAVPELDGRRIELQADVEASDEPGGQPALLVRGGPIADPAHRARCDLERLAIREQGSPPFIAAGAPWFLSLFGRDTLVTALMAGLIGSWPARGALQALGALQARSRDDFRDAEPGKLPHELRHGELARFGSVPHSPYFGTHDAPALYVITLGEAYRATGDRALLEAHLPAALEAMRWCEEQGDCDGDGLLEYRTASSQGYANQGWKDAGDAIPHLDGQLAEPPVATIELQGYWYAARLALAELFEHAGFPRDANRQRRAALELRTLVEQRFWMDQESCYALALDGEKRRVESIASNPGHLLWCGLPTADRARLVADRLLEADMFSGWGLRTLSAKHARYNPLSYQLGSVWPHDTAIFAAGLVRYGLFGHAARVLKALVDAAHAFEDLRLPELFSGIDRDEGAPVPYEQANTPQAWAAAAPVLCVQLFLGLVPDVPNRRIYLSPWLPDWQPELAVAGVEIGDGLLDVALARAGARTVVEHARHPSLEIVYGAPEAPMRGLPFGSPTRSATAAE
jgi:glycogen debranching enzyme